MKKDYLYIISCEVNNKKLYKIGVAKNLEERMKNLKTANPFNLKLEYSDFIEDAYQIEKLLHKFFVQKKIEGEWFENVEVKEIRGKLEYFKINTI